MHFHHLSTIINSYLSEKETDEKQKPPFETTNVVIDYVAEIAKVVEGTHEPIIDAETFRMDKTAVRWKLIEEFLQTHNYIMNANVRAPCGVSASTANRILAGFVSMGRIIKAHEHGHWRYCQKRQAD